MWATVHGPGIMPVWCSPLRHSWTVQCWTRAEQQEWICTLTGWVETITPLARLSDNLLLFSTWLVAAYIFFSLWMICFSGSKAKLPLNDKRKTLLYTCLGRSLNLPNYYLETDKESICRTNKSKTAFKHVWYNLFNLFILLCLFLMPLSKWQWSSPKVVSECNYWASNRRTAYTELAPFRNMCGTVVCKSN